MDALISVIVPIYNKEKYLEKSLTSIMNQTYKNLEVILVDDGSVDHSKEICKKYCTQDDRFRYIYKSNGGVASARNSGLENATGEYIGFVDPDDYIEKEMYQQMIDLAESTAADIVECGVRVNDGERYLFDKLDGCIESNEAIFHMLMWDNKVSTYLWNKLFKKDVIYNLKFNESLVVGEDMPFVFEGFCRSSKYAHTDKYLYTYFRNDDSLMGMRYNTDVSRNSIQASEAIVECCNNVYNEYEKIAKYSLYLNAYFQITKLFHDNNYKEYHEDFVYYKNIIVNTSTDIVKKYGDFITNLKVFGSIRMPKLYRLLQRIIYIGKDYYYC